MRDPGRLQDSREAGKASCCYTAMKLWPVLVSSIYTVEICPKSAEGGEKFLGLGATHLRSVDGFGRFWHKNGGSVDVLGGLGA